MPEIFFVFVLVHHGAVYQYANVVGYRIAGIKAGIEFWSDVRAGKKLAPGAEHGRVWNVWHVNRRTAAHQEKKAAGSPDNAFFHKKINIEI